MYRHLINIFLLMILSTSCNSYVSRSYNYYGLTAKCIKFLEKFHYSDSSNLDSIIDFSQLYSYKKKKVGNLSKTKFKKFFYAIIESNFIIRGKIKEYEIVSIIKYKNKDLAVIEIIRGRINKTRITFTVKNLKQKWKIVNIEGFVLWEKTLEKMLYTQ